MRAGQLNQRVTVLRPVETRAAGSGAITVAYEPDPTIGDGGTVWARVMPLSGQRYFAADQLQSRVSHEIRVRYQAGYRTTHRVQFEAEPGLVQEFSVEAVLPIESDHARLSLMCDLREASGVRH